MTYLEIINYLFRNYYPIILKPNLSLYDVSLSIYLRSIKLLIYVLWSCLPTFYEAAYLRFRELPIYYGVAYLRSMELPTYVLRSYLPTFYEAAYTRCAEPTR